MFTNIFLISFLFDKRADGLREVAEERRLLGRVDSGEQRLPDLPLHLLEGSLPTEASRRAEQKIAATQPAAPPGGRARSAPSQCT